MSDSKFKGEFYKSIVIAADMIATKQSKFNYILQNPKLTLVVLGWTEESFEAHAMHQYVECDDN